MSSKTSSSRKQISTDNKKRRNKKQYSSKTIDSQLSEQYQPPTHENLKSGKFTFNTKNTLSDNLFDDDKKESRRGKGNDIEELTDDESILSEGFRRILDTKSEFGGTYLPTDYARTEVTAIVPSERGRSSVRGNRSGRSKSKSKYNPFFEKTKSFHSSSIVIPSSKSLSNVWGSLINKEKTNYEQNMLSNRELDDDEMNNYYNSLKFVTKCCNISSSVIENLNNMVISMIASIDGLIMSNKVLLILTTDGDGHKTLFVFKDTDKQYASHRLVNADCERLMTKSSSQTQFKLKITNKIHHKKTETIFTFRNQEERNCLADRIEQ